MNDEVKKAIESLRRGGIVIFPTDTAFAVGCNVSDEQAVARLFELRRRPETKAVPVLIDSLGMARKYVKDIPSDVREQLMQVYWPGALTIILPCVPENVPPLVRGGGETIGLRIPNHSVAREIIQSVDEGIVGCSANFAGGRTPFHLADLDPEFVKLVDVVVPGTTTLQRESTVIDCSVNPWKVLREGAVVIA